jgi:flagellar hook assembly protein FlgD
VDENDVTPGSDMLGQNYPNPFTTSTSFTFATQGGTVTIQLFDSQGRLIRTILQQDYPRGKHEITVNRDGMPAGNYFYRITSAKEQSTKKMVVID